MSTEDIQQRIIDFIAAETADIPKSDYIEVLLNLCGDLKVMAEAAQQEYEDEDSEK